MEETDTALPDTRIDMLDALGVALPVIVLACFTVLLAMIVWHRTTNRTWTPANRGRAYQPTLLNRADATLDRAGVGPFGRVIFVLVALAYAALFLLALGATAVVLWEVLFATDPATTAAGSTDGMATDRTGGAAAPSLGLGALLAVFLGAPFLIWRTIVAQRTMEATQKQTALQDEALFNDKINAAATDLAARREVTRVLNEGKENETILTEWQDDLVTRAAAIDRLQGLAVEAIKREDFPAAQRIARMLSIYVQELSREYPAKPAPETGNQKKLQEWFKSLRPIRRPDMERAVRALGRINPTDDKLREEFDPSNIDLRRCNLQGFDLRFLNFSSACFGNADMQGAYLRRVDLKGAILVQTKLQAALLHDVDLRNGTLLAACLQGVTVNRACLQGANLQRAKLQGAYLGSVHVSGQTILFDADLTGAAVQHTDDSQTGKLTQRHSRLYADNTFQTQSEEAVRHWAVVF